MRETVTDIYHSEQEYYGELRQCVRRLMKSYSLSLGQVSENGMVRGMGGSITYREDLENLLQGRTPDAGLLEAQQNFRKELSVIRKKGQRTTRRGVVIAMEYLFHAFGLGDFEAYMVILAWMGELDHDLGVLFSFLNQRNGVRVPTIQLCIRSYAASEAEQMELEQQCISRWEVLSFLFAGMYEECRRLSESCAEGFLELGLKLEYRIVSYLHDYALRDTALRDVLQYGDGEKGSLLIHQELSEGLWRLYQRMSHPGAIFLHGEYGAGKKRQIAGLCQRNGQLLLLVDAQRLPKEEGDVQKLLFRIAREALLQGNAAICFYDIAKEPEGDTISQEFTERILWGMRFWQGDIFLTSCYRWNGKIKTHGRNIQKAAVPETTTEERIVLWNAFLPEDQTPDGIDMEFLADKYILSAGCIKSSVEDYQSRLLMTDRTPEKEWLLQACREQLDHRLGNDAVHIAAKYRWDDLVLPKPQKKLLRDACNQVMFHHQIYHRWGFEEKLAYGKGVSMIFYGPPGTGKTMGAQVIANELDLELYKVDMAGVMSKYVGESEKKLGNIFEQAKRSQSILFFDEADVLFGKRTDQKDSNDKYANASTAYLLQKIEEYEGIIILATNLLQNFDNAFLRRFKFIIEFPFTDQPRRLEIWQKVFPADTPKEELDYEFLAEEFKFSGSQIKNVAVAAAFLAAGENVSVNMRHVLTAVKRESAKTGKNLIAGDFGPYYYLMEEE